MIPEIMTAIKYIGMIGGGSLLTLFLSKWLGKTKEEAEIVLNWEEIHAARDKKLLSEIKRLEGKVQEFLNLIGEMKKSHDKEREMWEYKHLKQDKHIKGLEITIKELES